MGQKVNPHGLRVGVIKDWDAKWYAEDDFADNLVEDYNISYRPSPAPARPSSGRTAAPALVPRR